MKSFGAADIDSNKAMTDDAIFRIASMTKPVTSVAVMMLYENGKFLLDDPISKFIPEFKEPKVLTVDGKTVQPAAATSKSSFTRFAAESGANCATM